MCSQNTHKIFGALQTLERSLELCKTTAISNKNTPSYIKENIAQQESVLRHMRRTANKLQLDLAKKDWTKVHRSLTIFYSLNQMVRPEILATFKEVSGLRKNSLSNKPFEYKELLSYH